MPLTSLKSGLSMQPACHLEDGTTNARPGFIVNVASFLFAAVYLLSSFGEPTNGSELNSGRLEQRSHRHQPAPTTQRDASTMGGTHHHTGDPEALGPKPSWTQTSASCPLPGCTRLAWTKAANSNSSLRRLGIDEYVP